MMASGAAVGSVVDAASTAAVAVAAGAGSALALVGVAVDVVVPVVVVVVASRADMGHVCAPGGPAASACACEGGASSAARSTAVWG